MAVPTRASGAEADRAVTSAAANTRLTPAAAGSFASLPLVRIVDTRNGIGTAKAAIAGHRTRTFAVAGRGGIPGSGVGAVSLRLTAAGATKPGYLSAYPGGAKRPSTSTVNFAGRRTVSNLAVVRLRSGRVTVYNGSSAPVQLTVDVSGYYRAGTPSLPGMFSTAGPARVLDTRSGLGARRAQVRAHGTLELRLRGVGGVPATNVGAVLVNVTTTRSHARGYITVYPAGAARQRTSELTFARGGSVADLVVARVGRHGAVTLYNGSSGPVDLLADVVGYFRPGPPTSGGGFGVVGPTRMLDTRTGSGAGPIAARHDVTFDPLVGTAAAQRGARGIAAVAFTLTITGAQRSGPVVAYGNGSPRPGIFQAFSMPGRSVSVAVVVPVGSDGRVRVYNRTSGAVHVVADVAGYVLAPAPHFAQVPRGTAFDGRDVSCVSSGFCLAISGAEGNPRSQYTVYDGNSWSRPKSLPAGVQYVRCLSPAFCLAVSSRHWTRFNGTTWSTPVAFPHPIPVPESDGQFAFDCAHPTLCLVYGYNPEDGTYPPLRFDGTAWHDTPDPGLAVKILSCSATTCTGVGGDAQTGALGSTQFDGTNWSATVTFPLRPTALSCPGAECVAIGWTQVGTTSWSKLSASGWSAPAPVNGFAEIRALSCTSAASCTVVGHPANALTVLASDFNGTAWTTPVNRGEYGEHSKQQDSVSCASSSFCVAVVDDGAVLVRDGPWGVDPVFKAPVRDVSCSSTTWCVAIDGYGAMRVWNGRTWSYRPRTSAFDRLLAVSCVARDHCVAVGATHARRALVTRWNGQRWSTPAGLPSMPYVATVSCGSRSFCLALGYSGNRPGPRGTLADRFNGTSWKAVAGSRSLSSPTDVSCTSRGYCLALGYALTGPGVGAFDGTRWTTVFTKANSTHAPPPVISCAPSTTTCVVASVELRSAYVVHGTAPATRIASPYLGQGWLTGVSCTSTQNCVAVGTNSTMPVGWVTDLRSWSTPFDIPVHRDPLVTPATVSCATTRFCALA